jgi:hypothetical protein
MWEHNGKLYARVSDILKPFTNFGGIDEKVLNRKAALGTRIHEAIEQEIKGNFPVVDINEAGYLQSFHKWRVAVQPTFLETEKRYYCDRIMLTGSIDALSKLKGEEEAVLIDFKTSVKENPITWPMQAHLYHYLIRESTKMIIPRSLFVKLDRYGGMPKVFEYKLDATLLDKCLQSVYEFWENVAINP